MPEPIIPEHGARIMSLQDPTSKMSKSDPDEGSRILILDDPDTIRARVKRAVTDSESEVRYDWETKPGVSNLIEMMSLLTDRSIESIESEYGSAGYGKFKEAVAEAIISGLAPIRSAYKEMDDADVARIMQRGALDARTKAEGSSSECESGSGWPAETSDLSRSPWPLALGPGPGHWPSALGLWPSAFGPRPLRLRCRFMDIDIGIGKTGRRAWGFDDIAIVPSRRTRDPDDVDISWEVDAYRFEIPMLASAMDSAVSPTTAAEIGRLGGLGVLNLEGLWTRYEDPEPYLRRSPLPPRRRPGGCRRSTENRSNPI